MVNAMKWTPIQPANGFPIYQIELKIERKKKRINVIALLYE